MSIGDTSGRFEVAKVAARVFPDQRAYVERIIAEGIEPASDFPFGPYPTDRLVYRGERMVEDETPALSQGLGTASRMRPNDSPIRGVAILQGNTPDLLIAAVRLPQNLNDLSPAILSQIERER